jgi:hypothetical protein
VKGGRLGPLRPEFGLRWWQEIPAPHWWGAGRRTRARAGGTVAGFEATDAKIRRLSAELVGHAERLPAKDGPVRGSLSRRRTLRQRDRRRAATSDRAGSRRRVDVFAGKASASNKREQQQEHRTDRQVLDRKRGHSVVLSSVPWRVRLRVGTGWEARSVSSYGFRLPCVTCGRCQRIGDPAKVAASCLVVSRGKLTVHCRLAVPATSAFVANCIVEVPQTPSSPVCLTHNATVFFERPESTSSMPCFGSAFGAAYGACASHSGR